MLSSAVTDPTSPFGECDFFSSFSLLSKPSTLFSKASNTSVLGPRFFGTASAKLLVVLLKVCGPDSPP
jgi:hypothetical protein